MHIWILIGIAAAIALALLGGLIWQQWEYNRMYKENAKRALKRRILVNLMSPE